MDFVSFVLRRVGVGHFFPPFPHSLTLVEVLRVCKMSPRSFLALGTNADSISPA